ncbi:tetratricopeptide repeat protein [Sphingomonas adhaesiva]|uniref:tetratricopeptide repeat protein n=1 Tax=Sphingomonas adhaesiva TaxID=28212 RepID=UPI002FFB7B96
MGFLALGLLGAGAFGAMLLLGVRRLLWSTVGAALFLGAIGYAWQGRPSLAAAPARHRTTMAAIDPEAIALRDMLLGRYTQDAAYLVAADAMTRSGDTASAARAVMGGLSRLPKSFILWTWAGVTLAADAKDQVTPPALLAFRQAARLAPEHPAPPFYLGMAYVRAGQLAQARPYWRRAVALSPPGTAYRREIAVRLMLLDRFVELQQAGMVAPR